MERDFQATYTVFINSPFTPVCSRITWVIIYSEQKCWTLFKLTQLRIVLKTLIYHCTICCGIFLQQSLLFYEVAGRYCFQSCLGAILSGREGPMWPLPHDSCHWSVTGHVVIWSWSLTEIINKYGVQVSQRAWLYQSLLEVSMNIIALCINVCEDNWTAERAIIASNGSH